MQKRNIFLIVLLSFLSSCFSTEDDRKQPEKIVVSPKKYLVAPVEKGGVATTIKLPAQLAAYQEVSIFPKINGYVKTVNVDIGSKVSKGSVLMVLEAPELEQAVLQAKEKYLRSKADLSIDRERYSRLAEAAQTAGAVSAMDISTIKAKLTADSAVSNAEKANWEMQQTMNGYAKITAPFTGIITERNVSPGMLVSTSAKDRPMLELKDISHLRLQIDVPEALAPTLHEGDKISFFVSAQKGIKMEGTISRKAGNINAQYRSERVEIDVDNKNGTLSAGMYADVLIYSNGNIKGMYVPKSAVVTSTERKYVLVVRNGKPVKVDVNTGCDNVSKTEVSGALECGEKVIINANDEIRENEVIVF